MWNIDREKSIWTPVKLGWIHVLHSAQHPIIFPQKENQTKNNNKNHNNTTYFCALLPVQKDTSHLHPPTQSAAWRWRTFKWRIWRFLLSCVLPWSGLCWRVHGFTYVTAVTLFYTFINVKPCIYPVDPPLPRIPGWSCRFFNFQLLWDPLGNECEWGLATTVTRAAACCPKRRGSTQLWELKILLSLAVICLRIS